MATTSPPPPPLLPPAPAQQSPDNSPSSPSSSSLPPPPSPSSYPSSTAKPLQSFSPIKKPPPSPWSHQETVHLIQSYQEKWYSLKRGQLKANQWEEVAVTVAARCGYDEPSKTATQCRHKIEKLRKRYRAEKTKPNPRAWEYFDLMQNLEHGPAPISARPIAMVRGHHRNPNPDSMEIDEEEAVNLVNFANYNGAIDRNYPRRSRSVNRLARENQRPAIDAKLSGCRAVVSGSPQKPAVRKRGETFESSDDGDDEEEHTEEGEGEEEGEGDGPFMALAAEVKSFAERFVRMEKKKMEMMKEAERHRVEMENRRIEMIIESQRQIVDAICKAFRPHTKTEDDGDGDV